MCESHTPCGLHAHPPGSFAGGASSVLVEPREIHAPLVAVPGRERAAVRHRQGLERTPRDAQLHGPAAVTIVVVVDRPVHVDRRFEARHIPVPVADARAARMLLEADTMEGPHALARAIELRPARVAARLELPLPDEEDFVDRAVGVDLELIVGVAPGDEQLDVVVRVNRRIPFGQGRLDERLLDPIPDVHAGVIPEHGGASVVDARAPADQIGEARRAFRRPPVSLVEPAVDDDGRRGPSRGVAGDPVLGPGEGPRLRQKRHDRAC